MKKKRIELLENPKAVLTTTWAVKSSVKVVKTEKTNTDCIWLNPKCILQWVISSQVSTIQNECRKRFNDYPNWE